MKKFIEYAKVSWKSWLGYVLCGLLIYSYPEIVFILESTMEEFSGNIDPGIAAMLTGICYVLPFGVIDVILTMIWDNREKSLNSEVR